MSTPQPAPSSLFQRLWFVGFSGHRKMERPEEARAIIRQELRSLASSLKGELIGLSSAAAGADLIFLETCAELRIRTIVLLPFDRERFSQDFDNPEEWRRAIHCMDTALWCETVGGNEDAPAAYHVVNREMLDIADRMIFLWDGLPARGLGGTAEVVMECHERKIPARVISAKDFTVRWQTDEPPSLASDPRFADLPPSRSIRELFEKLDTRATQGAPRSRWFAAGSMSVNHVATFVQASLLALSFSKEMGGIIKFTLAIVAACLPWVGARMRLQERWVSDRVRAELLRSLLASHVPGSPLHPPTLDLFPAEMPFIRSAAVHLIPERADWETAAKHYLSERLNGQIRYLTHKGNKAKERMRVFGTLFKVASYGAIIFAGSALLVNSFNYPVGNLLQRWAFGFLPAVLPGIAAWSLAMISVFELKRRAKLYHHLVEELIRLRPKIEQAKCASAAAKAIGQIERLLLNELWEWQGPRKK
ncbi:MAG: hypothetical protein QM627_02345 [Luteolibacter sp.]